jgi:hypothetical protein
MHRSARVQMTAGFLFTGLRGPVDIIGNSVINVAALDTLALPSRLHQTAKTGDHDGLPILVAA